MINSNWTPVQLASYETIITQLFVKVCPLLSQNNDADQLCEQQMGSVNPLNANQLRK